MDPERWKQVDNLLQSVLECPPEARDAFLRHACAGDEALEREVRSLLTSQQHAGSFLEGPAMEVAARALARQLTQDPQQSSQSLTGRTVSHYRILAPLGAGGMGEVYLAQDTKLHRKVALKILPVNVAADRQRMGRFIQEAKAASALNHPNIITIHEIDQTESGHFIATEFIDGETLRQRMRTAPIKLSEVLDVATQVASALSAAHEAGIVHRDIKPENIMLRRDRIVKVLDFGLAKLTERLPANLVDTEASTGVAVHSEPGIVMGTVIYMSPEQARGLRVDARTDIFSLGVLIYEMVAGRLPFEGSNANEILASILSDREPPPLARYTREVPAELERMVEKALRKDREERYQVVKDMLLDLRSLRHRLEFEAELERSKVPETGGTAVAKSSDQMTAATGVASAPLTAGAAQTTPDVEWLASRIRRHRRTAAIIMATLLIAAASLIYFSYFARPAEAIDSIAVLPLVNLSGDPGTEYLSDGLTESIINSLAQLPSLRVSPRSSVFQYKGKDIDPMNAARGLGVRAVLTGRLLLRGDSLMVSAELVDVRNNKQLWGEQYNRKVTDALTVQQEISREICGRLLMKLSGEEQRQLTRRDTGNPEAYQFYLKGRYYWNKRTAENIRKAMEQFQQAIDRDPNYALAYVGIADCYIVLEEYAGTPASETIPKAKAFVERALQLDDSLAEGHASLAFAYSHLWQWQASEREFQRSLELNPNYATTHHWYSLHLRDVGRFDEAMAEIKRAQELDPLSLVIIENVAELYLLKGDTSSGVEESKKIVDLDPNRPRGHETLGLAYLEQGRYSEAIAELQKAVELSSREDRRALRSLGYGYAVSGKRDDALAILKEIQGKYERHEASPTDVAAVYAGLGEKDQAFAWLEKGLQERSSRLARTRWETGFKSLRNDPRYGDLLRRMGIPS